MNFKTNNNEKEKHMGLYMIRHVTMETAVNSKVRKQKIGPLTFVINSENKQNENKYITAQKLIRLLFSLVFD